MQDCLEGADRELQLEVCAKSYAVFNSSFCRSLYPEIDRCSVIPIGVNHELFVPMDKDECRERLGLPKDRRVVLFIGSPVIPLKRFEFVLDLAKRNADLLFVFVFKDCDIDERCENVVSFVGVGHEKLVGIMNACDVVIVPSVIETLHLSSLEAALCNVPVVTNNVGIWYENFGEWGEIVEDFACFEEVLKSVLDSLGVYSPREFVLNNCLTEEATKFAWLDLVNEMVL